MEALLFYFPLLEWNGGITDLLTTADMTVLMSYFALLLIYAIGDVYVSRWWRVFLANLIVSPTASVPQYLTTVLLQAL